MRGLIIRVASAVSGIALICTIFSACGASSSEGLPLSLSEAEITSMLTEKSTDSSIQSYTSFPTATQPTNSSSEVHITSTGDTTEKTDVITQPTQSVRPTQQIQTTQSTSQTRPTQTESTVPSNTVPPKEEPTSPQVPDYYTADYSNRPQPMIDEPAYILCDAFREGGADGYYRIAADGTMMYLPSVRRGSGATYYNNKIYVFEYNSLYSYDLDGQNEKLIKEPVVTGENYYDHQVVADHMGWIIISCEEMVMGPHKQQEPALYAVRLSDGKSVQLRKANQTGAWSFTDTFCGYDRGYLFLRFSYVVPSKEQNYEGYIRMSHITEEYAIDLMLEEPEMVRADEMKENINPYCFSSELELYQDFYVYYNKLVWRNGKSIELPESGWLTITDKHIIHVEDESGYDSNNEYRYVVHLKVMDTSDGRLLFSKDLPAYSTNCGCVNDKIGFLISGPDHYDDLITWEGNVIDLGDIWISVYS